MVESAALLVDEVLPKKPIRQGSAARLTLSRVVYRAEPWIWGQSKNTVLYFYSDPNLSPNLPDPTYYLY
jgi:hypothetical protein